MPYVSFYWLGERFLTMHVWHIMNASHHLLIYQNSLYTVNIFRCAIVFSLVFPSLKLYFVSFYLICCSQPYESAPKPVFVVYLENAFRVNVDCVLLTYQWWKTQTKCVNYEGDTCLLISFIGLIVANDVIFVILCVKGAVDCCRRMLIKF